MKNLIIFFSILLIMVSCKKSGGSSSSATPSNTSSDPVLSYYLPSSSPSDNASPIFQISRKDGSGFNAGTIVKAYSGSSCNSLLSSATISSYTALLALTVTINTAGSYQISVEITDPFTGIPACSSAISYTYNAPSAPTSIDLLSAASPSSNPNPKIRVNGIASHKVEIYLNSACSGTAFATSATPIFLMPPLQSGTYAFYAKTLSSTGVRSTCSSKLLDYQSLQSFSFDLAINTNPATFDYSYIETDDIDGDGNADYVSTKITSASSGIYFGNGAGTFGTFRSLYVATNVTAIKILDIDGDGRKDVLLGDASRNLSLFHNDGSRSFTKTTIESLGYNAFDSISYIEYVDINGDGNKDIVLGAPRDSKAYVKISNGNGTFQTAVDLMGAVNVSEFQIVDVNHDGYPDLLARGAANYKLYINNGSGIFALSSTVTTSIMYGDSIVGDMNGDGWPDIVTADGTQVKIMLNDQVGGFGAEIVKSLPYSLNPQNVKIVDLDGDTKKDVVFFDNTYNSIAVFLGNADGTLNYPLLYPVKSQGPFAVMDINNDGKKDVFTSSFLIQN